MAERLAELDCVPPAPAPDPETVSARASRLLADLIERARSTALYKLDEGRQTPERTERLSRAVAATAS